jgi:hypothetical protein
MKRKRPLSLYNTDNPPTTLSEKPSAQPEQSKSPYLKAIFSGTVKLFSLENNLSATNPDRAAALRYIKDSALLRKLYTGKMSC